MRNNLIVKIISFIAVFLVVLFIAEMVVRLFTHEEKYQYCDLTDSWVPDDILGWRNAPYYSRQFFSFGQFVRFATNVDGLRPMAAEREKKAGVKRVLLIGGSSVSGRQLHEHETLHAALESLLNASGARFEVINAAVDGYATDQSFLHLHRLIKQYSPDFVIYGYAHSDLIANSRRTELGQNKPYYEWTQKGFFLKMPEKNQKIQPVGSKYLLNRALPNSALAGLFRPRIYNNKVKKVKGIQVADNTDPTAYSSSEKHKRKFFLLGFLLSEMNRLCQDNKAQFFFYAHPSLGAVWEPYRKGLNVTDAPSYYEDRLGDIAQQNGVRFVKMVDFFRQNQSKGPFHLLPFDSHCNGMGYGLQAEVLAKEISAAPAQ